MNQEGNEGAGVLILTAYFRRQEELCYVPLSLREPRGRHTSTLMSTAAHLLKSLI